MKKWATKIIAVDWRDGEVYDWCGPDIEAPSEKLAQEYCDKNGMGYCKVIGELLSDGPCIKGTTIPDKSKLTDYTLEQKN